MHIFYTAGLTPILSGRWMERLLGQIRKPMVLSGGCVCKMQSILRT